MFYENGNITFLLENVTCVQLVHAGMFIAEVIQMKPNQFTSFLQHS